MILIELIFDAPPGQQGNVAELARQTTAATLQEQGCILYRLTTGLSPDRFILTELWESEDHLKAHSAGGAFQDFCAELPGGGSLVSSTAWQGPLVPYVRAQPGHPDRQHTTHHPQPERPPPLRNARTGGRRNHHDHDQHTRDR